MRILISLAMLIVGCSGDKSDTEDSAVVDSETETDTDIDTDTDSDTDADTDVDTDTQTDTDTDTGPPPCANVHAGDVTIVDEADIALLTGICEVTGMLTIQYTGLTDLSGLEDLERVGGGLSVQINPDLVDIDGLSGLTAVGDLVSSTAGDYGTMAPDDTWLSPRRARRG